MSALGIPKASGAALAAFLLAACGAPPGGGGPLEPIRVTAAAPDEPADAGAEPAPPMPPTPPAAPMPPSSSASFDAHPKPRCDAFPSDPCAGRLIAQNGLKGMPVEYSACKIAARPLGSGRNTAVEIDGIRLAFGTEDVRRSIEKLFKGNDPSRFPVESAILAAIEGRGGGEDLTFSYASGDEADRGALERWGFRLTELLQAGPFEVRGEKGAVGDHVILYSWSYYCGRLCGAGGHAVYTPSCERIYFSEEWIS